MTAGDTRARFDGRVVWITGGGGPLGRAVALALAARGARIFVTGRGERRLGETVGEIAYGGGKARHLVSDVRSPEACREAAARLGDVFERLDLLVCAAREHGSDGDATNLGGVANAVAAARPRLGNDAAVAILAVPSTDLATAVARAVEALGDGAPLAATRVRAWAVADGEEDEAVAYVLAAASTRGAFGTR